MDKLEKEEFKRVLQLIEELAEKRKMNKREVALLLKEYLGNLTDDVDDDFRISKRVHGLQNLPDSTDTFRLMIPDPTDLPPPPKRKKGFNKGD